MSIASPVAHVNNRPNSQTMDPSMFNGSPYLAYGLAPQTAYLSQQQQQALHNNIVISTNPVDHSTDPSSSTSPRESPNTSLVLTIRLLMQGKEVGSIIGKRGDQIKRIREESGAKINISDGSCPERIVTITGTLPVINKAFTMVCNKFEEDMLMLPNSVPKPPITMRLIVPATQCGSLIGKGGSKIKDIREATGASIQVASEMLPQSTERAVTISGSADAINLCMGQVCQILLEAPPKGATISYRPKPTFNPLLIASSAAAAAAAQQQQQQQLNALIQPQNMQIAALLQQQQQQQLAAAAAQQLLSPELAARALMSGQFSAGFHLQPTAVATSSAGALGHQELALFGGGLMMPQTSTGQPQDPSKGMTLDWTSVEGQQLMNQYAALNSSMLMGAPFVKGGPSPPNGQHGSGSLHHNKPASTRFNPY
ncbi:unnamed protein product [Caenorhabditis auriculariae]|uniref:K Homology domain-containing protein n=1 Tax=Caenorhabditis auriculariae TaxID=2777116 RepID=A0A8S1GXX2_9PELO|nr:unnamed protein product [Caenorhabditis auriculariae]